MGFALKVAGMSPTIVNERVVQVAQRLSIENLLSHSISALSEGQKQRVALGEILVSEPQALILDEGSGSYRSARPGTTSFKTGRLCRFNC